jgi:nucleotide-binding universal stress UspA family protein
MKKLKRIVVGIDISEKSDNVLKRALMIARENEAELFVVHAVETPWLSVPSYFGSKDLVIDTEAISKTIEKKIKALNTGKKVSYFIYVKEDDADELLLYAAKWSKADMMVLGAHSKTKGLKRFLGSIVQKVVHQSHLPVLIVKNKATQAYKNIVAPTDFQMQSKQSILFSKNIFPASKIDIVNAFETVYIMEAPYATMGPDILEYNNVAISSAKKEMKKFIKEVSVKKGNVIDGEFDSKAALINYINKGSYDLVAVGSRGTAGFSALLGNVATYVLRETDCDVLIYVPID